MKKPLLYPKLAWQGIRKNAETYLPYLLMGILMVGVSYIMNYLTRPALMGALSMGGTTLMVLQMGKIVISVFSVIFLYYCNSFLIRRRMKEFGLYNILGMGKGNIARVMLWETLLTALLVFAGGLLLGLSLSRLVEMALINLLHADYTVPMELFYPDGVTWVLLLFGGIYVLILLANLLRMRLSNPVALLKSENTGEKPPKANWFFGLIGLLILLSAYYVAAVSQSPLEALIFFFIAVLMVIVATYLLLVSGSVTLCRMLRRNKRYYYQTRHFISVSAMAYRMKRNGAGMATICILCTMVLVILTSTVCLYGGTDSMVDAICPQDINLTIGLEARDGEENWKRLDAMQQMALDVTEEMGLTPENITSQRALVATGKVQNGDYGIITDADSLKANVLELTVYPLSVYEQATGETVTLADRELLYASFKTNETFSSMSFYGSAPYRMIRAEKELPKRLLSADYRSAWGCLVVFTNDAEAFRSEITALVGEKSGEAMMMDRLALHFDLASEADTDTQEKLVKTLRSEAMKLTGKDFYGMSSLSVDTRSLCRRDYLSLFGGLFFLGMVLGPLFSIAAVLIMYYKQICEGYEDAERFAVMRKVGLTDAEIRRSVNSQVLTVFFAPLLMAGLHMLFAMPMIRLILGAFGLHNDSLFYGIGIGCYVVFAVIYALMYLLTSRRYYRIVR
ncbi:MAG: FtsX-like permease family protein [Christensenellales bacterium]|jgi:Predicted ABC-type transport system involved in lysophospholipase L1 biosynthesis, permease component|nr:FtsX-like permease family protein [Christensenellales bacterium]